MIIIINSSNFFNNVIIIYFPCMLHVLQTHSAIMIYMQTIISLPATGSKCDPLNVHNV